MTEAKAGVRVKPESLEPEEKKPAAAAAAPAGAIPPGTVIGDGHIKIAHVRIDTRLLHGQVATTWTKQINPQPHHRGLPTALLTTSSARP